MGLNSPTEKFETLKNNIFSLILGDEEQLEKLCAILELHTEQERLAFVKEESSNLRQILEDFKNHGSIFEKYHLQFDPTLSRKENVKNIFAILNLE